MPTETRAVTHSDIHDRQAREAWAQRFGVTVEHLRKAVRVVGNRITTLSAHLGPPGR